MQFAQDRKGAALRRGFTLVELVIVVLVIGILTAVAAPRMMDTAGSARSNGTKQSLAVLRSAIELHRAQKGAYPTLAQLTTNPGLLEFLSGPFPAPQVGASTMQTASAVAGTSPITAPSGTTAGWIYDVLTGEIRVNTTVESAISW